MYNKRKGINLIVLVITIIIVIILASAVILNVNKNNPVKSSNKAKFLNDMDVFSTECSLYILNKYKIEDYDKNMLYATNEKVIENGIEDTTRNIADIIPSIKGTRYENKIEIVKGKLTYTGQEKDEVLWSQEANIDATSVNFETETLPDVVSISGNVNIAGNLVKENEIEKYEVYVARKDDEYSNIPSIVINDKSTQVEYYIEGLKADTEYKIKVVLFMSGDEYIKEIQNIKTLEDNEPPDVDSIVASLNPNIWTNESILVTLENIPGDAVVKEYTLPGSNTWIPYTEPFAVSSNGTINVRVEDEAGNEAIKTFIIDKIDKTEPSSAAFSPNSVTNVKSVTVGITALDNESGVKSVKYQWKTTNVAIDKNDESWNSAASVANGGSVTISGVTETNYLQVLVEDNAGNKKVFVSSSYVIDNTAPNANSITATMSPSTWTNGSITVTLGNIPADAVVKEYTLPGSSTWTTYTEPFAVSSNGTINVRVEDASGNEATKTFTVDKIDKTQPVSVVFSPNSASNVKSVTVGITAKDNESGVKSVKYQWKTTNTTLSTTDASWNSAASVANGGNITRSGVTETDYLQVLVEDNAGNKKVFVSSSYVIDNTAPNANGITATMSPSTWTNGSITVTLGNIPADAVTKEYTIPGSSTWIPYTGAFTVSKNGTINVRVEDASGNEATKTFTIDKIDETLPSKVTFTPNSAESGGSVTVKVTGTDNESGVKSVKYQWKTTNTALSATDSSWNSAASMTNGGSITRNPITETNYLQVLVEDKAGNKKVFVSGLYKMVIPTYIPNGFTYSCGTVETGYVIKDTSGNEFVWIPVDGVNVKYGRYNYGFGYYVNETDVPAIKTSVETYKGFYVARYEAGDASATSPRTSSSSTTNKVVSQPNKYVYNYIKRDDAYTLSNNMYNRSSTGVTSTLMTSYLWETMLQWIGTDSRYAGTNFVTNSAGKGWYSNNASSGNPYHKTGISYNNGANCVKNIYDLAGNVWEWAGTSYTIRGAYYMDNGSTSPVAYSFPKDSSSYDGGIGFRVVLYK